MSYRSVILFITQTEQRDMKSCSVLEWCLLTYNTLFAGLVLLLFNTPSCEPYWAGHIQHTHTQIGLVRTDIEMHWSVILATNYMQLSGNDGLNASQGTGSHMPLVFIHESKAFSQEWVWRRTKNLEFSKWGPGSKRHKCMRETISFYELFM